MTRFESNTARAGIIKDFLAFRLKFNFSICYLIKLCFHVIPRRRFAKSWPYFVLMANLIAASMLSCRILLKSSFIANKLAYLLHCS